MKKNITLLIITLSVFLVCTNIIKAQDVCQVVGGGGTYIIMNTQSLESLDDYEVNPVNLEFSKYGGWKARQTTATGFFRVEKIDGRWWAIDPEGYYYVHKALNSASVKSFEPNEIYELLIENGFNGLGCWSQEEILESPLKEETPLAYCPKAKFMANYRAERFPSIQFPVFDDEFETFSNAEAQYLAKYVDDPHVFGYFSDNELPWRGGGLPDHTIITDTSDKNYITAINFLEERDKTVDNWDEEDEFAYMGLMSERYFSVVSRAIKAVDPNHMFLGSRCNSVEKRVEDFMRNAGKYVDIFSNNHYSRWGSRDFEVNNMAEWSGRPLMMTEFYCQEYPPTSTATGAGFKVKDQVSRGLFYQNYLSTLAEDGNVVGWHWFKFEDDGNGNKGIVSEPPTGTPYTEVLDYMKELNMQMYNFIDYADSRPEPDVVLNPEADAYYKGDTNYNDHELLGKFSNNIESDLEIYIRFDLSTLPSDIGTAKIKLFSIGGGNDISNYQAELVTNDNWNESTINASNSPDGSNVLATWSSGGDITIDVTEELLDALDDNNKLSIRVLSTRVDREVVFYASSEHPDPNVRPKLMVYTNTLSVDDSENQKISIYPNPVPGILNVTMPELDSANYEIINSLGMIILSGKLSQPKSKIDMSGLNQGLYFLRISNKTETLVKKMIKK